MTDIGFAPEEIDTATPTRRARLKWVVAVRDTLPPGQAANAAICVAAATMPHVAGLLGPDAKDADGTVHPGLPWTGCSIVAADAATLREIRAKATAHEQTFVADMPAVGQAVRVYDEYLDAVSRTPVDDFDYAAVGIVGPRNKVDRIIRSLPLL
ncbi:DUF2000 domain-containing protein [Isoptericola sp. 4D.3]|jgi:hypothetical protein|uniref:DUF2000 domain-containing protein n=1 Tax=Isoptericola peretonis TaxID=2918523 RepID=A0ABT0J3C2_9MICO|nr:DUF2000 domain-containing protein [Isoptericola sp. 4D.3]